MLRRIFCFLLCMLMALSLFGCAGTSSMEETTTPGPSGEEGDSQSSSTVGPVRKPGVGEDGITKDIYTLPHTSSQRNIPEGSNVRQVDGKWIIAANMDTDYYLDTGFRQAMFFILSEEPFDYRQVTVDVGNEAAGLQYSVNNLDPSDGVTTLDLTKDTYFCYAGFDFRYYRAAEKKYWTSFGLPDDPGSSDVDIPDTEEFQAAYERYVEILDSYQRLADEALPQFYAYYMYIGFFDFEDELTINEVTVSWPGVEETIDVGQIRLHPEYLYSQYYPETFEDSGIDRYSTISSGSDGQIFGPELAVSSLTWDATEEIIIKNVYSLNESYPVVAVRVKNTTPDIDNVVTLSDDSPAIVSPGARFTIQIYFTGPHLSELNVCGQGYFVIEYECGGVDYQALWEGGQQRICSVSTAYMMLFDMVDLQGYVENVIYAPDKDAELYELIGWTDDWARRYS